MSVRKRTWTTSKGEQKEAWIVDYSDQDGDRHIRSFTKKKDADKYHAIVTVDVDKGLHTAPSKSVTVAEAAESWIKLVEANGMRGHGPAERSTIRQYRQHIDLHIVSRIGGVNLAKLTQARVEIFRNDLLAELSRPLARKVFTSSSRCSRLQGMRTWRPAFRSVPKSANASSRSDATSRRQPRSSV